MVYNYLKSRHSAKPLYFYPGDEWDFEKTPDIQQNINKYNLDYKKIKIKHKTKIISEQQLKESLLKYKKKIKGFSIYNTIGQLLSKSYTTNIFLWDHKQGYSFSHTRGLTKIKNTSDECDYQMSSESLYFIFQFDYGIETLQVNGRYKTKIFDTRDLSYRFFASVIKYRNLSLIELIIRIIRKLVSY